MANDGLMYRADMKFCDNIITDNQNSKKELPPVFLQDFEPQFGQRFGLRYP